MQPTSPCRSGAVDTHAAPLPRFWRITFADLVSVWGEEQAEDMLRAMQRAHDRQEPASRWTYDGDDLHLS